MPIEIRKVIGTGSYEEFLAGEGVQFGYGLFETIALEVRTDGRWTFRNLEGHFQRLKHSAKRLSIHLPQMAVIENALEGYARDMVMSFPVEVPESLQYWAIKLTVLKNNEKADLLLSHRLNPYPAKLRGVEGVKGVKLVLSELIRDEKSVLTYHKTTNYLTNLLEKRKAIDEGYDDCFFLNRQGYISETTVANLFFMKERRILTPALPCGILPGTVRAVILKQARVKGVAIEEVELTLEALKVLDGAAICNALMGAIPVMTMGSQHFKASLQLADTLSQWVEEALCEQS